jgi:molybdopterin-guanine dinucleotide biosynthesis protein MobB
MKLIQIVGRSNSGKTTFINTLIPVLRQNGQVAVIKHLGDHEYQLEEDKDTTLFFHAGASISVGIDSDKSVVALHTNNLDEILSMLFGKKMDFVIIEGFKTRPFPKIVIGDLDIGNCVLRNPTTGQVIESLEAFEDFYTK